jgi:para-aminobenzoate synthetase/4-amino-4-deoxychorismate lyase
MPRWHALPPQVYSLVEQTAGSVLLESAAQSTEQQPPASPSHQSRLFVDPLQILVATSLADLPALFAAIDRSVGAGLQAAGYFSYECAAYFEPAIAPLPSSGAQTLAWFGIYRQAHIFDHLGGTFIHGQPARLDQFSGAKSSQARPEPQLDCIHSLSESQYAQRIAAIHQLIRAGDVYQLNFTMPIHVRAKASPAALYGQLRSRQPAPFGAFLHTQAGSHILSLSPELFFRIDAGAPGPSHLGTRENKNFTRRITTRPMKGTAPRGRTTAEDRAQAVWLAADPKNRAENVMIVDLLRNDLGRLCEFGSIHASDLFAVERYPTLWQMTSTISGNLRPGVGFEEIFRALFPCGSVTGAPKIRAMQCIAQLEQQPRSVYTGAIGFFSKEKTVFNVAIRTLTLHGEGAQQTGTMGIGSGIVIDSEPAAEWRECQLKAHFLTGSPERTSPTEFSLIETLLWNGEFPFLDLHLERLEDSAHYFDFPFNRNEVKARLKAHATHPGVDQLKHQPASNPANSPTRDPRAAGANLLPPNRKVRLLLNSNGQLTITSEPIPPPSAQLLRLRIAAQRTVSTDPFYFHKTTNRPVYAGALAEAIAAGYDDALFLNEHGQITEATIHNLFIEKAGRLLTPPIDCGLLPGVHRRHILATHPAAEERVLTLHDLRHADAVYLSNAVRGLRPAVIDWENA